MISSNNNTEQQNVAYSRADYGPKQAKPWPADKSMNFDTTEQFQKGSPKIVVNSRSENHVLRNHGSAKNINQ